MTEIQNPREVILNDPNSIIKFYKYTKFRDEFSQYRPISPNNESVITEDFDNQYVKVLFKAGSKSAQFTAFLKAQKPELNVTEVSKEEFLEFYKGSQALKNAKMSVRNLIRYNKDIEDDITDQKIVLQNLLFFICDLWKNVLTNEQKEKSKYKEVITPLADTILSNEVQVRANLSSPETLTKILQDEKEFAEIAKEYLDKKSGNIL